MSDVILQMDNVRFRPHGAPTFVLDGVNLEVRRGEWVLIMGPSGAGKTTLVLCLNGIVPHSITGDFEGEVRVAGRSTRETPVAEMATDVGMVFQDPDAQIVHEIVRDEVYFGLENLRRDPVEIVPRAHEALRTVGIFPLLNAEIMSLSGGQKQRVSLASVLALSPQILVLDEPTANLDPQGMRDVFTVLERVNREHGVTVVMVEHHVDELAEKVDRVVVLERGRVVLEETPGRAFTLTAPSAKQRGLWLPQTADLAHSLRRRTESGLLPVSVSSCADHVGEMLQISDGEERGAGPATPGTPPAEESAPLLEVTDLSFAYPGGEEVLKNVSLRLRRGGITALVGPNGSGKTTLAKCLTRINQPPAGAISLDGVDITRMSQPDLTRRVGYVFQNPDHQFVADRTFDEVAYSLRVRRTPDDEVDRRVRRMLDLLELGGRENDSPFGLSVGERRRLSVATMLILEQELVILDEPTIGQDLARSDALFQILDRLCREQGTTMIFITHDMRLVADWCPRTIVMSEGRVLYDGPTAGVFETPDLLERAHLVVPPIVEVTTELRRRGYRIPQGIITVRQMRDFMAAAAVSGVPQ
jgi:energy-coupling factor transport system ATP-binding protein